MKKVVLILSLSASTVWGAGFDALGEQSLSFSAAQPDNVLAKTLDNPKAVFENFVPQVDSSSKVIPPIMVGGTQNNPVLRVNIRKCVSFICQTVELDAAVAVEATSGPCQKNFKIVADLSRSGSMLTDSYRELVFSACYSSSGTQAKASIKGVAVQSSTFEKGMIQAEVLKLMKLQVPAVAKALKDSFRDNGATN